jgi:hypothetical protein|tara:strand:+ start:203 stop:367 length:165 start_codon:yes stop_codon:yes gene_type:complete
MQIIAIEKYDWGHALPDIEKPKIAKAIEGVTENILAFKPQSELIVVETIEDTLE